MSSQIMAAEPNAPGEKTLLRDDFVVSEQIGYIQRLLGTIPTDLRSGRTAVYYCPIDGDNTCGVAACSIEFTDAFVMWRDFVWDGADDELEENDNSFEAVKGLSSYRFDRQAYEHLLVNELERLQQTNT